MIFGKHINKYLLRYLVFFVIAIGMLIVVDWFQLEIPKIIGSVVDKLQDGSIIDPYSEDFINTILEIIKVAVILFLGRVIWRLSLFHASSKIEANIRHDMFLKAERLSTSYYHTTKVGTIMSWLTNDLDVLNEFIGWGPMMLTDGIFLSIFALVKMFMVDWALSLIALIPILFIAVWGALVEKFMSERWKLRQESSDRLFDFSQENFTGIRVIKAFVKENRQIRQFAKIAKHDQEVNVDFVKISVIFDMVIEIIINCVFAILLGFGGWFAYAFICGNPIVIFGHEIQLKASTVVEMIGYFDTLVWPMIAIGQVVTMYTQAKASFQRLSNFLDTPEDIQNPVNAVELKDVQGEIIFNHLSFKYPNSEYDQLKDISLTIKPGEKVGVVGRVGSGKSTLVNLLLRQYNIDKNSIFIDGVDIMETDIKSLRHNIGYVPQDNFLFSDSIKNNIGFSKESATDDEVIEAASFSEIHESINSFPDKYETISGERGQTLSGGQKQRISIARAFLKKAPILVMDDSVSAVDIDTEKNILNNIKEKRAGLTTIVISSRVSTVNKFDKIIVLNNGELEAYDTPENLINISSTYQKMVALQRLEAYEGGNA